MYGECNNLGSFKLVLSKSCARKKQKSGNKHLIKFVCIVYGSATCTSQQRNAQALVEHGHVELTGQLLPVRRSIEPLIKLTHTTR